MLRYLPEEEGVEGSCRTKWLSMMGLTPELAHFLNVLGSPISSRSELV